MIVSVDLGVPALAAEPAREGDGLRVKFSLPSGSYATVVIDWLLAAQNAAQDPSVDRSDDAAVAPSIAPSGAPSVGPDEL